MSLDVHRLYYLNLPLNNNDSSNCSKNIELTFLKNTKFPTFIYTGNQNIKIPKYLKSKFGSKFVNKINKRGLEIYLYEPLCCYIKGKGMNKCFYNEFSSGEDLLLIRSQELDSIQKIIDTYGFHNVSVYTCDYNVEKYLGPYYNFKISCKDLFLSDIKNSISVINNLKKIEKHFWCGIGRYTYPRHLIISYLANFSGNYTWHYTYYNDLLEHDSWLEKQKLDDRNRSMLKNGNKLLNDKYFYIDDKLDSREIIDSPDNVYIADINFNLHSKDFLESYNKCFVAVVAETRYAQPTANISEKLLHCIGTRTPFIMLAPPYTLEYIRSLGFATFSQFWDEKYDTIENPTDRLKEIFSIIDRIGSMTIPDMENMYQQMSSILDFNLKKLKSLD